MRVIVPLWKDEASELPEYSSNKYTIEDAKRVALMVYRCTNGMGKLTLMCDEYFAAKAEEVQRAFAVANVFHPFCDALIFKFSPLYDCGGWSRVMQAFSPVLWPDDNEVVVLAGMDTVFWGDMTWLFDLSADNMYLPIDPYFAPQVCDAVVVYGRRAASIAWKWNLEALDNSYRNHLYNGVPSEMVLLRDMHAKEGWPVLEAKPHRVLSYKVHVRSGKHPNWQNEATIVYFHGQPKPTALSVDDPLFRRYCSID